MHRNQLLNKLTQYQESWGEEKVVQDFVEFIKTNKNCFDRELKVGHITGSALLLDPTGESVLLTHHKKLGKWLQLGGHSDGDSDTLNVAFREAQEESGIEEVEAVNPEIFHIDKHFIPASKKEPEHYHYDVRFLFKAKHKKFVMSDESNDLRWFYKDEILEQDFEDSLQVLLNRWLSL